MLLMKTVLSIIVGQPLYFVVLLLSTQSPLESVHHSNTTQHNTTAQTNQHCTKQQNNTTRHETTRGTGNFGERQQQWLADICASVARGQHAGNRVKKCHLFLMSFATKGDSHFGWNDHLFTLSHQLSMSHSHISQTSLLRQNMRLKLLSTFIYSNKLQVFAWPNFFSSILSKLCLLTIKAHDLSQIAISVNVNQSSMLENVGQNKFVRPIWDELGSSVNKQKW